MQPTTSLINSLLLFFLSTSTAVTAFPNSNSGSKSSEKPCTVYSPTTGSYFDLNHISLSPPQMKNGQKVHKDDRDESWHAKGYDYGANFTINICAPVIENVTDVVGVDKSRWQNISAYYEKDDKIYSIGQQASNPLFRGRKLVLNYTDGSPCPSESSKRGLKLTDDHESKYLYEKSTSDETESTRRKSTVMSFLCDRETATSQTTVSFVGTMDSCTYFFEVRSSAACGGAAAAPEESLSPAGVFGIIMLIAVVVYMVGGCAYQRTVMHQRGWRQCPNYSMWAGIASFIGDFFIIIFSSLTRCFTDRTSSLRGGYSRINGSSDSGGHQRGIIGAFGGRGSGGSGRRSDVDAENRLIDQLDEEWED